MALQVEFSKTHLGVPVPQAYGIITSMFLDSLNMVVRLNVRFYFTESARKEDVEFKRSEIERKLLDAKDRRHGNNQTLKDLLAEAIPQETQIQERLDVSVLVQEEIKVLQHQLENVSGTKPFFETKFEVPANELLANGLLTQGYDLLKTMKLVANTADGELVADLTQALDV